MRMRKKMILFFLIFLFFIPLNSFSQITDRQKVDYLQTTFDTLTSTAAGERYGHAIALVAIGGTYCYLGVSGMLDPNSYSDTSADLTAIGTGVLSLGLGIYSLAVPTGSETLSDKYRSIPENTAEELRTKAEMGEALLKDMAESARTNRMILGGIMAGLGGLEFALYLITDDSGLMVYGLINLLYAGINLFLPKTVEIFYGTYQDWTAAHTANQNTQNKEYKLSILPLGLGINVCFSVSF